jgi:hypothetical protein
MREAVDALPAPYRSVLLLTEIAGVTYGEVADTLGIGKGTVGSRRTRALAFLDAPITHNEPYVGAEPAVCTLCPAVRAWGPSGPHDAETS